MRALRIAAMLVSALALSGPAMASPQHEGGSHASHDDTPMPVPAVRWKTDATLRDGMGRIHQALDELRHAEMGHMSEAMARDRAGLIEDAGVYLFAHCQLEPRQDAVLHQMLVPLLAAARKFKEDPQDVGEVAAMRQAVTNYPRYFDDPAWKADAASSRGKH